MALAVFILPLLHFCSGYFELDSFVKNLLVRNQKWHHSLIVGGGDVVHQALLQLAVAAPLLPTGRPPHLGDVTPGAGEHGRMRLPGITLPPSPLHHTLQHLPVGGEDVHLGELQHGCCGTALAASHGTNISENNKIV